MVKFLATQRITVLVSLDGPSDVVASPGFASRFVIAGTHC